MVLIKGKVVMLRGDTSRVLKFLRSTLMKSTRKDFEATMAMLGLLDFYRTCSEELKSPGRVIMSLDDLTMICGYIERFLEKDRDSFGERLERHNLHYLYEDYTNLIQSQLYPEGISVCGDAGKEILLALKHYKRNSTLHATPLTECKCSMREKLVGDGCAVCNPELAIYLAKETDDKG